MPATSASTKNQCDQLNDEHLRHLTQTLGIIADDAPTSARFRALALAVRDRSVARMLATEKRYRNADAKRVYYLSLEFLIGRSLINNLDNLGLKQASVELLQKSGIDLADVEDEEIDAALGNGGLGRLAACFLDSLATLGLPGFGYGINYDYGLFRQEIRNGEQFERPDNWKRSPTPWQVERPHHSVIVPLYGHIEHAHDRAGGYNPMWVDWKVVIGVPSDIPIVGYGGETVNYLRLFSAKASEEVDMGIFNMGDYLQAVQQKVSSETISKVLYPSESVTAGRELRLIQEYFLVACSLRDIIRQYQQNHDDLSSFADKVAIQLNDTHPALTVAELMRILIDESGFDWDQAWDVTTQACAYTNHTLLPEALERWPQPMIEKVLPRHLQIIHEINRRFLETVEAKWPDDDGRKRRMSIIEEGGEKQVRMAHLSIVGSHSVNGVAAIHSELVKHELVPDFYELWPEKFNNKTNGVTQRRWLNSCNPGLAQLVNETIGTGWITDLDQMRQLEAHAADSSFQDRFQQIKTGNKRLLANVIASTVGEKVDCEWPFDIHIKRIHEYKRQLLNLLHIVHEYLNLVDVGKAPIHPRVYIFGGKAAPGYYVAKQIIYLINEVAHIINNDKRAHDHLKLIFLPDYRVSLAEKMIPAADVSEQVSTAGTEASGTGNMKFAMNGALTIGTLDGANIEIRDAVGPENIYIFGLTVDEVRQWNAEGRNKPYEIYQHDDEIRRLVDAFRDSRFCPNRPGGHQWVFDKLLTEGEQYFHLADMRSFIEAHDRLAADYKDRAGWIEKAIYNVARMGMFSSDRTIAEYAKETWGIARV